MTSILKNCLLKEKSRHLSLFSNSHILTLSFTCSHPQIHPIHSKVFQFLTLIFQVHRWEQNEPPLHPSY